MDMRYQNRRQAPPITFTYRNHRDAISQHTLLYWQENAAAVQGREVTGVFASFSKARIVAFVSGAEGLKHREAPPAPDPLGRCHGGTSPRIYFQGFSNTERYHLELLAAEKGMHVLPALMPCLEFCCYGPKARWRELQQAFDRRAWVLQPQQLVIALETGEVPDYHPYLI